MPYVMKPIPLDLSAAVEIRFCLGDDDIGVEPLGGHLRPNELLERIATNKVDGSNRRVLDRCKGRSLVIDRSHFKASAQRDGRLLNDQVIQAPRSDRQALSGVVQPGQARLYEAHLVTDRRDDADGLDRLQFCLAGFEARASAEVDGENGRREAHASIGAAHGVLSYFEVKGIRGADADGRLVRRASQGNERARRRVPE